MKEYIENTQKIEGHSSMEKIRKHTELVTKLYEQKFNRADWDAKKPEAIKWFNKCKVTAYNQLFAK